MAYPISRRALVLLLAFLAACAHAPRAPDATSGAALAEVAPDAAWFVETTATPGVLVVEGDRATLTALRGGDAVRLRVSRERPVWRLVGEAGGVGIDLRLLHANDDFAWIWAVGSPLNGFAHRLDDSPEPLLGEWIVERLAGSELPRAIRLERDAVELVHDDSVRRLDSRILVADDDERLVALSEGWETSSELLHLRRIEGGWLLEREGSPVEIGVLHRPGDRPAWLSREAASPSTAVEPRRFVLPSVGEARLELDREAARVVLPSPVGGEESMRLRIAASHGPLVRFADPEGNTDAFLLQAGERAWFWVEGEGSVVPAFAVTEPSPALLGAWSSAVAKLGAGGHEVAGLELQRDRVAFVGRDGKRTEYGMVHTGPPRAPVLLLTGAASGLTVSLLPRGEVVFVRPSRPELTLTLLHRAKQAPAWVPLASADELLDAFCEEARRAPRTGSPDQRVESVFAALEARGLDADLLKQLLRPISRMPGDRYELLLKGLANFGAPKWKCGAVRELLGAGR